MTVSAECRSRRSKRRKSVAELESENSKLRLELTALKTEMSHDQQKAEHGCTGFSCRICDNFS